MTNSVVTVRCHPASMQDFATSMPATRGLIAGPWTPLALLCCRGRHARFSCRQETMSVVRFLSPRQGDGRSGQTFTIRGDRQ
jgi:hypothetical protein